MDISAESIWGATQDHLRFRLNSDTYNLWFAPLRARGLDHNSLVLEVANEFCGIWLQDNYAGLLQDAVAIALGRPLEIRFEVGSSASPDVAPPESGHLQSKRTE